MEFMKLCVFQHLLTLKHDWFSWVSVMLLTDTTSNTLFNFLQSAINFRLIYFPNFCGSLVNLKQKPEKHKYHRRGNYMLTQCQRYEMQVSDASNFPLFPQRRKNKSKSQIINIWISTQTFFLNSCFSSWLAEFVSTSFQ